jgi:hypothetical protein
MVSPKSTEVGTHDNIFGVSDGLQSFFNTGLLRAVIMTIVASLAWHIIASAFPAAKENFIALGKKVCKQAWYHVDYKLGSIPILYYSSLF